MPVFYIPADIIEAELIINILKKKVAAVKFSLNVLIDDSGRDKGDDSILIDVIVFNGQFLSIILCQAMTSSLDIFFSEHRSSILPSFL